MNWFGKKTERPVEPSALEELDPVLRQALGDFKASVDAWSEDAQSRPRNVVSATRLHAHRLAAGWALAGVLFAATASGGGIAFHQHKQAVEAARQAEIKRQEDARRQAALERAKHEEELFASVDTAIAREVPSAMEPLTMLDDLNEAQ